MKPNKYISYLKLSLLIFILMGTLFSHASIVNGATTEDSTYIYDTAGLLSSSQESKLEDSIAKLQDKYHVDVLILTVDDTLSSNASRFIEDFIDEGCEKGYFNEDNVILFISTKTGDRRVEIQGYGRMEDIISNSRVDTILDDIQPLLSDNKFDKAVEEYVEHVTFYLKHPNSSLSKDNIFFQLWFQILLSLGIGGIAVGIMSYHSSGRITTNSRTYIDSSSSRLVGSRDIYLRTTTKKVRKPQNNGGSGKSGGGRSAGGRSHSGGGRSF